MTLVVALAVDERREAALHLGAMIARTSEEHLVVCTVVPQPWVPSMARVDAEYRAHLDEVAQKALDEARESMPSDLSATYARQHARSVPAGLVEAAREHDAQAVVLGPSSAGAVGRVVLGSVTDRMVHRSPVPVVLAARGFRCGPTSRVTRLTVAYGADEGADELVVPAAAFAARVGVPVRLATFVVRTPTVVAAGVGSRAESEVTAEWVRGVEVARTDTLARVGDLGLDSPPGAVIGHGRDWDEALADVEWDDGDLLVVGSSAVGPVARVFLGSRAAKILRSSPVPVLVVPRAEPGGH